jgi:hypothetical protein
LFGEKVGVFLTQNIARLWKKLAQLWFSRKTP